MENLHGIYLTKLKKYGVPFGVKIGVSATPEKRACAKNQKAFDRAVPCGKPEVGFGSEKQVRAVETEVKNIMRRFRIETANRTTEIFLWDLWDNIVWAIQQSLISPRKYRDLVWRAANGIMDLSRKPEVEIFISGSSKWEGELTTFPTRRINAIIRKRFLPFEFFSPRFDAGHATEIVVKDTPNCLSLTYLLIFSISPDPVDGSPCWSTYGFDQISFIPSERLDIEKAYSKSIRAAGYNCFSVRFTETINKKTGRQKTKVSSVSGRRLDEELEMELLQAEFFDDYAREFHRSESAYLIDACVWESFGPRRTALLF